MLMIELKEDNGKCRSEMKQEATTTRNELAAQIDGLTSKIDVCLGNYNALGTQVADLRREMEESHANLAMRLDVLERNPLPPGPSSSAHDSSRIFGEVLAEIEERRRRASNAMVYGFVEPVSSVPNISAIEEDLRNFKEKLNELSPELVGLVRRLQRFGERAEGKCRPLKVIFDSPSAATKFLAKNRTKAPPVFSASSDRTPRERQSLNHARAELKRRTEQGEENLTIKYINHEPQVVTQRSGQPSKKSSSLN